MKLYYYCSTKSCQKVNTIVVKSNNRYDLKKEIGEEINERCKYCGTFTKRHINRLHAKPNNINILIGTIIVISIITILLLKYEFIHILPENLSFIKFKLVAFLLLATIPIAIWRHENKKASNFNKVMID